MQTATLSRRLRNIVTKSRCRQAPRQRVASHNTHSCWRPASASRWASRPPPSSLRRRAHPCARSLRHASRVARGRSASLRSVRRHAPARVLRTPTQPRARYAPTQSTSHARSRGRLGLTAARFKPNPLRCCHASYSCFVQHITLRVGALHRFGQVIGHAPVSREEVESRHEHHRLGTRIAPNTSASVSVGALPRHPVRCRSPLPVDRFVAGADTRSRLKPNRKTGTPKSARPA